MLIQIEPRGKFIFTFLRTISYYAFQKFYKMYKNKEKNNKKGKENGIDKLTAFRRSVVA